MLDRRPTVSSGIANRCLIPTDRGGPSSWNKQAATVAIVFTVSVKDSANLKFCFSYM